jgi:hypothetical protein
VLAVCAGAASSVCLRYRVAHNIIGHDGQGFKRHAATMLMLQQPAELLLL